MITLVSSSLSHARLFVSLAREVPVKSYYHLAALAVPDAQALQEVRCWRRTAESTAAPLILHDTGNVSVMQTGLPGCRTEFRVQAWVVGSCLYCIALQGTPLGEQFQEQAVREALLVHGSGVQLVLQAGAGLMQRLAGIILQVIGAP